MHERAQVGPSPQFILSLLIAVTVIGITIMMGMNIAAEISATDPPADDIQPGAPIIINAPAIIVVALLTLATGVGLGAWTNSPSEPAEPDRVTVLQDRYVEGELDLDEFEEQLYDEIEVTIE